MLFPSEIAQRGRMRDHTAAPFRRRVPRVVNKLGRALGGSLVWPESTPTRQVVPGSSDLLRPIEGRANS